MSTTLTHKQTLCHGVKTRTERHSQSERETMAKAETEGQTERLFMNELQLQMTALKSSNTKQRPTLPPGFPCKCF